MGYQVDTGMGTSFLDGSRQLSIFRLCFIGSALALLLCVPEVLKPMFVTQDGRAWLYGIGLETLAFHRIPETVWLPLTVAVHVGVVAALFTLSRVRISIPHRDSQFPMLLATGLVGLTTLILWRNIGWTLLMPDFLGIGGLIWTSVAVFGGFILLQLTILTAVWLSIREGRFVSPFGGAQALFRVPALSVSVFLIVFVPTQLSWLMVWPVNTANPLWFPSSTFGTPSLELAKLPETLSLLFFWAIFQVLAFAVQVIGTGWIVGKRKD